MRKLLLAMAVLLCLGTQGHATNDNTVDLKKLPPTYSLDGIIIIPPWVREEEKKTPEHYYRRKFNDPLLRRCNADIQEIRRV